MDYWDKFEGEVDRVREVHETGAGAFQRVDLVWDARDPDALDGVPLLAPQIRQRLQERRPLHAVADVQVHDVHEILPRERLEERLVGRQMGETHERRDLVESQVGGENLLAAGLLRPRCRQQLADLLTIDGQMSPVANKIFQHYTFSVTTLREKITYTATKIYDADMYCPPTISNRILLLRPWHAQSMPPEETSGNLASGRSTIAEYHPGPTVSWKSPGPQCTMISWWAQQYTYGNTNSSPSKLHLQAGPTNSARKPHIPKHSILIALVSTLPFSTNIANGRSNTWWKAEMSIGSESGLMWGI